MGGNSREVAEKCSCSLPPGSTYYHCRACCRTYTSIGLWDNHRYNGHCYEMADVYIDDGLYSTAEGHAKRKELSIRFRRRDPKGQYKQS